MRLAWFGAVGVFVALAGSCLLDLDHDIACGDGYVDPLAGEECDPGVPSSYVDRCTGTSRPEGEAACDPTTCAVINDKEQCAACGDDITDEEIGEECDGSDLNGEVCPGGGSLRCSGECLFDYSLCDPCGNGMIDGEEECDPEPGGLTLLRECAGNEATEPLEPIGKPYASGATSRCDECRYDRTPCGFCGDGILDDGTEPVDFGVNAPAEWCDGDILDPDRLTQTFGDLLCTEEGQRINAGCEEGCRSFIDRTDEALCCLEKSQTCPPVGDPLRCCYEYDHPDEEPCQQFFEGKMVRFVCR